MDNTSNTRSTDQKPNLHRAGEDRIFAGVAGGLGEHFGVNAWWFRWAFVFLALFAGMGLLVYILAWVVIPGPDEDEPIVAGWVQGVDWSDGGTVFGIVLVGAAVILFATQVIHVSGLLVLAAVLFLIGVLLYRGDVVVPPRTGAAVPPPSTPPPSDNVTVDAEAVAVSAHTEAGEVDVVPTSEPDQAKAPPPPPRTSKPPRLPRERSILGRLTIAVGLIVVATMALVEVSDLAVDIEPFHYLAAAVAVLGLGLLVGAWAGRARWLIIIGVLIAPLLWLSMLVPTSWDFSIGEFQHSPATVEEYGGRYEQGMGQMTIDLTNLSADELAEIGIIEASLGFGEMVVRVPGDIGVVLRADVAAGEVSGPFNTVDGIGIDVTREFGPDPTVLVLDLEVGAGVIHIAGPGAYRLGDVTIIEGNN